MRFAALLLIGMATAASAEAQTSPARFGMLPMSNTLPTVLFAPDPLAGTLLRPLTMPSADSTAFAEVAPEPAVLPVATALLPQDEPLQAAAMDPALDVLPVPDAMAPAGALPEAPPVVKTPPPAAGPPPTTITVIVENVETASGNINVAINVNS